MDNQLVIKLIQSDKRAFEQIYSKYYYKIYSIAKMYVGYADDAQEVVQDVFVRLWETRSQINPAGNFDGYLFMITRNIVFDRLRKEKSLRMMKMAYIRFVEEHCDDVRENIMAKELREKINDFVENLPPRQKEVFLLSRKVGLTRDEIASKLKIKVNAVDRNIHIVLSKLKEVLTIFIIGLITLYLYF